MSSLRSAKISRNDRRSGRASDSCSDRHFILYSAVAAGLRPAGRTNASVATWLVLLQSAQICERLTAEESLHSGKLHPRHSPRKAGLAHLLEHFLHLRILAEQVVDFLHAGAGAAGDAFAAGAVCG